MGTSTKYNGPKAIEAKVDGDKIVVKITDGREFRVAWKQFMSLRNASDRQRSNVKLIGGGIGLYWPDIDEDLSVKGLIKA